MVQPTTPPKNGFVRVMRKVYNPMGFQKGYNFTLYFIFAGALFAFALSRSMYLDVDGTFCGPSTEANHAALGECYYYQNFNVEKIGIRLHLYMIIPCALLVVFQFVPAIRHKVILFHRINGYIIILMSSISSIGVLMIARHAFGGGIDTQTFAGFTVLITTLGYVMAWYNIKRLQIDQHRAWMLRTWFYFSSIITQRFILVLSAIVISNMSGWYSTQPCAKLNTLYNTTQELTSLYPDCAAFVSGANLEAQTVVRANMMGDNPAELMGALNITFGMAAWLALAMHAVGVEIYIRLTPRESERLRKVSYQRQLEAGMKNPGSAGLTPQRLGDANEYQPLSAVEKRGSSTDSFIMAPASTNKHTPAARESYLASDQALVNEVYAERTAASRYSSE